MTRTPFIQETTMISRSLAIAALGALLAGCATPQRPEAYAQGAPYGYWYHDGNHYNTVVSPSPQAIYNATHGVWLWPPADVGRRG
jgi:uncharacterized lipoprotein YajG